MLTKNSYQPKDGRIVPFFAKDEQLECGCYNATYGVYSRNTAFLPFVLNLNLKTVQAFSIMVYHAETGKRLLCLPSSSLPHELYKMTDGTHRFVYSGGNVPGMRLAVGTRYYIELLGFRSCEFTAVVETDCFLKVTLGNGNELFGLPYHRGWQQWVWLDGQIGGFDWDRFAIEEKDDLGRSRTVQSRLEKVWSVEFFDAPEPIYKVMATSAMLDYVSIERGALQIEAVQKRSSGTVDRGEQCERTVTLKLVDAETEPTDGACNSADDWENVNNETGANTCDLDVWIDTGAVRCIPNTGVGGCDPLPQFSFVSECINNAGRITITPINTPAGQAVEFSVDNGSTFKATGVFTALASGTYIVRTRHVGTLCLSEPAPVTVACGDGGSPEWEFTGVSFCLKTADSEIIWEPTGVSFCLKVAPANDGLLDEVWEYPGPEADLNL